MMANLLIELNKIGLTKQEASLYLALLEKGALTAKEAAEETDVLINAIYRTAKGLKKKGLVEFIKNNPLKLQAIPLELALQNFVKNKTESLNKIIQKITGKKHVKRNKSITPTTVNLVFGKEKIFNTGAEMLEKAKKEILVVSIGEPLPPNLLLAVNKARRRGVIIRMIAHKYDEENKEVLENLKKNGYEIRYSPNWGFHLAIYDHKSSLLIVNNPEREVERVAMQVFSPALSGALRDYFYSVWGKAVKVE